MLLKLIDFCISWSASLLAALGPGLVLDESAALVPELEHLLDGQRWSFEEPARLACICIAVADCIGCQLVDGFEHACPVQVA